MSDRKAAALDIGVPAPKKASGKKRERAAGTKKRIRARLELLRELATIEAALRRARPPALVILV